MLKSTNTGRILYRINIMDALYNVQADQSFNILQSLNSMQKNFTNVCTSYGMEYDVKDINSGIIRIGPRFNPVCATLQLAGNYL